MRRSSLLALATPAALLVTLAVACSRPSSETADAAPSSPTPSASAAPSAPPAAASAAPAGGTTRWSGTYKGERALMYIPRDGDVPNSKEWDGVKFRGDDAGIGLGDGEMTLVLDGATGRVSGTIDGTAGPAVVYGSFGDGRLAVTIARKDATDEGLTGTGVGTIAGDKVEGSMRLAESNARVVRVATFTLAMAK